MTKETTLSLAEIDKTEECPGDIFCYQGALVGISYGIYQFASTCGVPQAFVGWLNKKGHPYGRMLAKFAAGTREFSCCWKYLGEHDPEEFSLLQDDFVKANYFMPTVERLITEFGLDVINGSSNELRNIIWLMSIEFGPAKTIELIRKIHSGDSTSPIAVSQMNEDNLVELIKKTLATAEWLEAKRELVSGLCLPGGRDFVQDRKLKKASA